MYLPAIIRPATSHEASGLRIAARAWRPQWPAMKPGLPALLACPACRGDLALTVAKEEGGEILEGTLSCACGATYPVRGGIPRFTAQGHYADSFGWQWNRFALTQLDSHSGLDVSRARFRSVSGWPERIADGLPALEVGCGAGRFTEIAASTGVELVSLDASSAVDAARDNCRPRFPNCDFVQGDLLRPPFRPGCFPRVFCFGVIQHTPDPRRSFQALVELVAPGGELAFDVYARRWDTWLWCKYWLRPLTRRLGRERLLRLIERAVPAMLLAHDALRFIPGLGRFLACHFVPVCTYRYSLPLSREQNRRWAVLDTFDMLSPEHDHPQTLAGVRRWVAEAGGRDVAVDYGPNGIAGRFRKA